MKHVHSGKGHGQGVLQTESVGELNQLLALPLPGDARAGFNTAWGFKVRGTPGVNAVGDAWMVSEKTLGDLGFGGQ
jgi:hypothetical protein